MARTKIDPIEKAEITLRQKIHHETDCKVDSSVGQGVGTHKQYRLNDHKATQRSVEYYQARLTFLRNGAFRALTSMDRQEVRRMACLMAEISDAPGTPVPARCEEICELYRSADSHYTLLLDWMLNDWAALACLWLGGVRSSEVAQVIRAIWE